MTVEKPKIEHLNRMSLTFKDGVATVVRVLTAALI
jgi:hypothetical protein